MEMNESYNKKLKYYQKQEQYNTNNSKDPRLDKSSIKENTIPVNKQKIVSSG
jgi:hypothetical protein